MRKAPPSRVKTRRGFRARAGAGILALALAASMLAPAATTAYEFDLTVNSVAELSGLTAQVVGSVEGVNVRAEPSPSADIVTAAADGTVVALRIDRLDTVYDAQGTRWWPVSVDGVDGWIAGYYLGAPGSTATPRTSTTQETVVTSPASSAGYLGFDTPSFAAGAYVAVMTDDGDGLQVRSGSGLEYERIATLGNGDVVQVVDGPFYDGSGNGWYLITDGSFSGYTYGGFLTPAGQLTTAAAPTIEIDVSTESGYLGYDTPSFAIGSLVEVVTDDGGGLRVRDGASVSAQHVATLGYGDVVTIVDGPFYDSSSNGWYLVSDGSFSAYAFAGFLAQAGQSAVTVDIDVERTARFAQGVTAASNTDVNVRSGAAVTSALIAAIPQGTVVEVVDGPWFDNDGDDWYFIETASISGFAMGEFFNLRSAPAPGDEIVPEEAPAIIEPEPQVVTGPTGSFIYPLQNYVFTQDFGCSQFGFYVYNASVGCPFHDGIDIAASAYSPVMASDGGVVTYAGWCDCGLGYYVEIDHGNGFSTIYGHMAEQPYVSAGQTVNQGDVIGPVGSTGLSTGPHVHFMILQNGVAVDPLNYL